jgi:hypothetical protein
MKQVACRRPTRCYIPEEIRICKITDVITSNPTQVHLTEKHFWYLPQHNVTKFSHLHIVPVLGIVHYAYNEDTVTNMTSDRQRFGKHRPKDGIVTNSSGSIFATQRLAITRLRCNGYKRRKHELFEVVVSLRFSWTYKGRTREKTQRNSFGIVFSFVIRHSGRGGTRSPVRNGASLRQSLIVRCYNLLYVIIIEVPIIQSINPEPIIISHANSS